jgi:hypothetical protein
LTLQAVAALVEGEWKLTMRLPGVLRMLTA